ncbi:major facilitator superfamily domain-containing protein [Lasiosphaeris hirsuta]|uniref:Major facilitator superfamily domain-containing protein n=1 Tax=Lasiosphaeris hirsuta TaxID=260670 RepID=A0AA40B195_9PEZI|nr:major facilitator superfamily domain-containing protein [Lasiosphaeris hirsuta]
MDSEKQSPPNGNPPADRAAAGPDAAVAEANASTSKGWRFWAVFPALCITTLLAAVEATVVSTALPVIVHEIGAGEEYVWILNAYLLTSCAFMPLLGQLADIWGRRYLMILVVVLFALGAGIAGGANNLAMMVAGRAIQGIGGGGVNFIIQLIICDLVPLRERGNYMGILFLFFTIGTAMGPFIGGAIVERASWRWVFYINLPIAGAALVLHLLFLQVKYEKKGTLGEKLRRIDWIGNILLIAAVVSVLIALSWGGTRYPWGAAQVVVPLVLGLVGLVLFHLYETAPWVAVPILPERLFTRRTPAAGLVIAFLDALLLFWVTYFFPAYLQAVKGQSPIESGVNFLPTSIISVLTGVVCGVVLSKTGRYRPMHFLAFGFQSLGLGLFSCLNSETPKAEFIGVQVLFALGIGFLIASNLPAIQADLPDKDASVSAAAFNFMRGYGGIWGVSVPAAIFNARCDAEAWRVTDLAVRQHLTNGRAYGFVASSVQAGTAGMSPEAQAQVTDVFTQSLRMTWQVGLAFSLLGFFLVFVEKEIVLRTTLETEYGLKENEGEGKRAKGDVEAAKSTDLSDETK